MYTYVKNLEVQQIELYKMLWNLLSRPRLFLVYLSYTYIIYFISKSIWVAPQSWVLGHADTWLLLRKRRNSVHTGPVSQLDFSFVLRTLKNLNWASNPPRKHNHMLALFLARKAHCGRGGIRTLDPLAQIPLFESGPFNLSGTLP